MPRQLRFDYAGALHHVYSRGNERRPIFRERSDFELFLHLLAKTATTFRWRLYAYALMTNHYHLLFETREANLSKSMHRLNGCYAQRFNRRYGRCGYLFQRRFDSILVEKESHFLELIRYVVLNPVRAGITATAGEWEWSSYCATAGLVLAPPWLDVGGVLAEFHPTDPVLACQQYREFVADAKGSRYDPWEKAVGRTYLGSEEFLKRVKAQLTSRSVSEHYSRDQREPVRATIDQVFAAVIEVFGSSAEALKARMASRPRLAAAYIARSKLGLARAETAGQLGIGASAVTNLVKMAENLIAADNGFRQAVLQVLEKIHI